jgi:hypothetical protein
MPYTPDELQQLLLESVVKSEIYLNLVGEAQSRD